MSKKVVEDLVVRGTLTIAGSSLLANVVEDTTPQLGGNLDVNGNSIVSVSDGDITLAPNGSGEVVVTAGINFPDTQAASSDVNTLDDYEEGTFTPEVADSATGGNQAAAGTFTGYYTKIGNLVHYGIILENIDTTGMTGAADLYIRALPFTPRAAISYQPGTCLMRNVNMVATPLTVSAGITGGNTHIRLLYDADNTTLQPLQVQELTSTTSDLYLRGTYLV